MKTITITITISTRPFDLQVPKYKPNLYVHTFSMETELVLYNSSTSSSGLSTLSNTTKESLIGEETLKWTNAEIARLNKIIIRPILIIVGTVGNCLTFYIMRKSSMNNNNNNNNNNSFILSF